VLQGYEAGVTIAAATRRAAKCSDPDESLGVVEKATRRLLRKVAKS